MQGQAYGRDQRIRTPVKSETQIPRGRFKSWYLFLVCNPSWLLPEKTAAMANLFQWYEAFGIASEEDHAAVWFYQAKSTSS
jgi:hypothetical protein